MAFSDYSTTPSANTSLAGIFVGASMARADVDNAIRQIMADAKRFSDNIVSVKEYGAAGDGTTDDTTPFINALASLASTGGVLRLPKGNYALASASLAAPIAIPAGVMIEGDNATITVTGSSVTASIFRSTNVNNTGVRGVRFVGNGQGTGYTNGNAITFLHSAAATAHMTGCYVKDCYFDNFKTTYWVQVLAQNATYTLSNYQITGNSFTSRAGNSITPSDISMNASFICVFGDASVTGKCGFGLICNNTGDATYVKTGVQVFHSVKGAIVANNIFDNAGQTGANDDCGAYAIFAYADPTDTHGDLIITSNILRNPRSIGIYVRGDWPRTQVLDNEIYAVTDTTTATLPKGGICMLAGTDFAVKNNYVNTAAAYAYFWQPNATNTTLRAIFDNNSDYGCGTGLRLNIFGASVNGMRVSNHVGREFTSFGCVVAMYDTGTLVDATVGGDFQTTVAATRAISLSKLETNVNCTRLKIGGNTTVKAVVSGIEIDAAVSSHVTIEGVKFRGTFTTAGLLADSAKVRLSNLSFEGQTVASGGYCLRLTSATGTIAPNVEFGGSEDAAIYNASGTVLGVAKPTHSGTKGDYVKALAPAEAGSAASKYITNGWRCTSTTNWFDCRELTGN
jgi:hypothetical protein